jgi:hypothetical protein
MYICEIYERKEEEAKYDDMIDTLALCLGRYMTRNLVAKVEVTLIEVRS